jgi:hypoxanthine phosphoribosyltransferase
MMTNIDSDLIHVHDRAFRLFISRDEIAAMVQRIAKEINADYASKELVILVILKGAMVFAADLIRELRIPVTVEVLRAASYHNNMHSKGSVDLDGDVLDIAGRHVLIVEDIVDSGLTMTELVKHLANYQPASVGIASLLSKPDIHQERVQIDYLGCEIPPYFVVGYGLDYAHYGRQLDSIWRIVDESST